MNLDSASSASSGAFVNQRKERGAIAAQACDTCRSRKQKCDETRPKCSLCQRMKLECRYREPQATKKDKTLVEILDRLKSLEGKVDRIPTRPVPLAGFGPPQISPASQPSFTPDHDPGSYAASSVQPSQQPSPSSKNQPYRHASAAHKMLTWPAIQQMLLQALPSIMADLQSLEVEGSAFIVRMQKGTPKLPLDEMMPDRPFVGMQTQATRAAGGARTTFPGLTYDIMHRLATVYFDTFNLLYPFMDRQNFLSDTLGKVHSEGFNGDTDSVIALLVLALGGLAQQGLEGESIEESDGRPSGLRGGTLDRPPGLALFNEARKRMGFVLTECDLENVQIFSLAALYYESCSRHADFWRLTVSASLACQVLITCNPIDWNSSRGDIIKRVYWHCVIMETGLHLELDLPLSGIVALQDHVKLPSFDKSIYCEADERANQGSQYEQHYASQIALRRVCAELHNAINDSMSSLDTPANSSEEIPGPSAATLKHLAGQLDQWRESLPIKLQWPEEDPTVYPPLDSVPQYYDQSLDPSLLGPPQFAEGLFTPDIDRPPRNLPYVYDIQVALLRTRYYYAKYMVYRPFVYKALHFPSEMTQEDVEGVASCLKSCLRWPLTLSPPSRHKRLVPYLFCWSQNFLGVLLILHMSQQNQMLRQIRQQLCGETFEEDAGQSIVLMLDWIRDLKSSDPIAAWCYNLLQSIYHMDG